MSGCSTYVLFQEFNDFSSYIQVLKWKKMLNIDCYYRNESEKKNNISPHYCQDDSHQKVSVSQPGNIFILLLHPPRIMHYHGYVYISSGSDGKIICLQCWRPRSLGWEDPLEKEIATHSSTLAWKIPWMQEPHRLQSMGSQRVRHD